MPVMLEMFNLDPDARNYAAGTTIFKAGDIGEVMYVILEGQVELHFNGALLDTLGPGEPFGEMALIDGSNRIATAVAKTECRLAAIPEKRFLFMVQQTPYFSLQLMRVIVGRLSRMDARMVAAV